MKTRPIIFSAPMVQAILEGRKTQTRRVVKPQPVRINDDFDGTWEWMEEGHYYDDLTLANTILDTALRGHCPLGKPKDRLWVRETHCLKIDCDGDTDEYAGVCAYKADVTREHKYRFDYTGFSSEYSGIAGHTGWRPSIHMPRWASRITLEITNVRVERVMRISHADVLAEGITQEQMNRYGWHWRIFQQFWDSVYAKRGFGWSENPWVWILEFHRLEAQ